MTGGARAGSARLQTYEDCEEAINSLFMEALRTEPDRAFVGFLDFAKRFSALSIYNAMLLQVQMPGATAVATARKWARLERHTKPGARPLVILQPFGPVLFVYDVVDTEGPEIEGESANSLFASGILGSCTLDQVTKAAGRHGVRVSVNSYGATLAGFAKPGHRIHAQRCGPIGTPTWEVVINGNLDPPSQFATLAHELGHVYCGHLGGHPEGLWLDRRGLSKAVRELEAEAVAWLVSTRNGVNSRSADYLANYASHTDLERVSMFGILDAANRVESRSERVRRSERPNTALAEVLGTPNPANVG